MSTIIGAVASVSLLRIKYTKRPLIQTGSFGSR